MGKFGKKNIVSQELSDFMIGVMAPSGFGKTTLMYQVCDRLFGDDGYLILDIGAESGTKAINGVVAESVQNWKKFKEVVDDIVKNKSTDYPALKVVVLDTLDSCYEICETAVVAAWNRENMGQPNFRPATSINSVESGYGRGMDRVNDTVMKEINRLNDVGVGVWWTSHVKEREQTDLFTGNTFTQLTANMTMKYFNCVKNVSHIVSFGYYDRSIETEEVGSANPITKKKKTREAIKSEDRKLIFRDNSYCVEAKSRFANIIDEINLDADEFIKAIQNAIAAENGGVVVKPVVASIPVKSEPDIEIDESDAVIDDAPFDEMEDEGGPVVDPDALCTDIRAAFKSASADKKKKVKEILTENGNGMLSPDLGVDVLMDIANVLGN